MTRWINGLPRNRGRFRRRMDNLPTPAGPVKTDAEARLCQVCGSRNKYVALLVNQDNLTKCVPSCHTVQLWLRNEKEEVGE